MPAHESISSTIQALLDSVDEKLVEIALARASSGTATVVELEQIDHAATVYEFAALQMLLLGSSEQRELGREYALRAYRCRSHLSLSDIPEERTEERLAFVGLSIVAGKGAEIAYKLQVTDLFDPQQPELPWDEYFAQRLIAAWTALGAGADGWTVALFTLEHLLSEQGTRERPFLEKAQEESKKYAAARSRLIALYHLAQATYDIASGLGTRSFTPEVCVKLDLHFAEALRIARPTLGRAISWLRAAATELMAS